MPPKDHTLIFEGACTGARMTFDAIANNPYGALQVKYRLPCKRRNVIPGRARY